MKSFLWLALPAALLLAACGRPAENAPSAGYEYFPMEVGQYSVFEVQETEYTLTAGQTTRRYQVQETVTGQFTGLDGQPTYRLERASRTAADQSWQLDSVWTARRTPTEAIRTENGTSLIKLLFPLYNGQQWDANRLNNLAPETYRVEKFNEPLTLGSQPFEQTATVVQAAKSSLVDSVSRREIYARGVGLVYRERCLLYTSPSPRD